MQLQCYFTDSKLTVQLKEELPSFVVHHASSFSERLKAKAWYCVLELQIAFMMSPATAVDYSFVHI